MQPSLIDQGLDLMLYGMGTVFVFLTILVFATALMSRIINALSQTELDQTKLGAVPNDVDLNAPSAQVLAAIKLAIKEHRLRP